MAYLYLRLQVAHAPHQKKGGGSSVTICGVFTWFGLGFLVKFNQPLTRKFNAQLLGDHL